MGHGRPRERPLGCVLQWSIGAPMRSSSLKRSRSAPPPCAAGNLRQNVNNTPLTFEYVTAMVKGGSNGVRVGASGEEEGRGAVCHVCTGGGEVGSTALTAADRVSWMMPVSVASRAVCAQGRRRDQRHADDHVPRPNGYQPMKKQGSISES